MTQKDNPVMQARAERLMQARAEAEQMTRERAKQLLCECAGPQMLEAVALIVETADTQGDYHLGDGEDSVWEDDVQQTLNGLAAEFRGLSKPEAEPPDLADLKGDG